ncbi:hypothetical protein STXM2123_202 [Streptomyces sp. F-3]|nr:hypothetical protein STXM2123_202 [Streptomyces sp. F-3]
MRFGRGGRGDGDEVTVDDVMAGPSRANRRTMPGSGRVVRVIHVTPCFRRARKYPLCPVRHAVVDYKTDISFVICHEVPSFAADFDRAR